MRAPILQQWRHDMLHRWAAFVCDHPALVLILATALAAGSLAYTFTHLAFHSDRNDLISRDLPWNQNYIRYSEDFESGDRVVVVVVVPREQGGPKRAEAFVDRLAGELAKDTE